MCSGYHYCTTKSELRFCAGSSPDCGVSEIRDNEDFRQQSRLEIRLSAYLRSTIPRKQFIIIIIIIITIIISKDTSRFLLSFFRKRVYLLNRTEDNFKICLRTLAGYGPPFCYPRLMLH